MSKITAKEFHNKQANTDSRIHVQKCFPLNLCAINKNKVSLLYLGRFCLAASILFRINSQQKNPTLGAINITSHDVVVNFNLRGKGFRTQFFWVKLDFPPEKKIMIK
jgi:hypothetical protein